MDLAGRAALITGGGTGLGRAIALELARRGVNLALDYSRSATEAAATAAEARALGVWALALRADVANESEVRDLVARTEGELGRFDLLVCNAGVTRYAPLADLDALSEAEWDRILAVNVRGAFFCARAAAPVLRRAGGAILNVSSNSGLMPAGSSLPYVVSKAMLIMLTKCLAAALAPEVRVNALAPGFILGTRWLERVFPPDVRRRLLEESPTPPVPVDDVARAALLLLENDSVTGQTLVVDKGELVQV
jgi:3-oxoacyl-[acyl-carrier protein] reductase